MVRRLQILDRNHHLDEIHTVKLEGFGALAAWEMLNVSVKLGVEYVVVKVSQPTCGSHGDFNLCGMLKGDVTPMSFLGATRQGEFALVSEKFACSRCVASAVFLCAFEVRKVAPET